MRKFILMTAMVLASASAQAGQSRNLSPVASNDPPPAVTTNTTPQPQAAQADTAPQLQDRAPTPPSPPAPPTVPSSAQYNERPPVVTPATTPAAAPPLATPPTTTATTTPTTTSPSARGDAPRRAARADRGRRGRGYWTEARIIGELHRYGIYW
jgi:hypothetical protein